MSTFVTPTSHKKKKTALLLCIFGGIFGLHQFYVGRIGRGFVYLFTCGLFFIGWAMDLVKIILGKYCDNIGMPLRE